MFVDRQPPVQCNLHSSARSSTSAGLRDEHIQTSAGFNGEQVWMNKINALRNFAAGTTLLAIHDVCAFTSMDMKSEWGTDAVCPDVNTAIAAAAYATPHGHVVARLGRHNMHKPAH
jgi:hypothetical protein